MASSLDRTISAKELGALAMPGFCPRCYWLRKHNKNRLPFRTPPPGIFSSVDKYTKLSAEAALNAGMLDKWIPGMGKARGIIKPNYAEFKMDITDLDTRLTGVPDHILELQETGFCIVDYKTARFTEGQQRLLAMYDIQVNAYALIAKSIGIEPVKSLFLVYMEPLVDEENVELDNITGNGFSMRFQPFVRAVRKNEYAVLDLVRKSVEIMDMPYPPDPNPTCPDCAMLESIKHLSP